MNLITNQIDNNQSLITFILTTIFGLIVRHIEKKKLKKISINDREKLWPNGRELKILYEKRKEEEEKNN